MKMAHAFRNEFEFRAVVAELLEAGEFSITQREFSVSEGKRVDFRALKDGKSVGIEVKFDRRGLLDDISKCQELHKLPEFDEVYVVAWIGFLTDEYIAFARQLRVGILAIDGENLIMVQSSGGRRPALLNCGSSHSSLPASPASIFSVSMDVTNLGEKAARDVEMFYLPAAPFASGRARRRKRRLLSPEERWQEEFQVRVRKTARPGIYPLPLFCIAPGARRSQHVLNVAIGS